MFGDRPPFRAPFCEVFTRSGVVLPFCGIEIILSCFQTGRMNQWARAHFFVGRDKWRSAAASLLKVPAYDALVLLGRGLEWKWRDSGWAAPGSALAVS